MVGNGRDLLGLSKLSRVPRVIAGDPKILDWGFGSNAGDLPIHSHNGENTYFSLLRLIHGVAKINKQQNCKNHSI